MSDNSTERLLNICNPKPRTKAEAENYSRILAAWNALGSGKLLGIQQLTAREEANLRQPGTTRDPASFNPRWVGEGVVTAIVTAEAVVRPGDEYRSLQSDLNAAVDPGVAVELVPWGGEVPEDHQLAGPNL
jgi:hypothetical protein